MTFLVIASFIAHPTAHSIEYIDYSLSNVPALTPSSRIIAYSWSSP
jgi:hypothetical protein